MGGRAGAWDGSSRGRKAARAEHRDDAIETLAQDGGMSKRKSWGGAYGIARALPKITRAALRRQGFAQMEVVTRWPAIVGDYLAARSAPERLAFPRGGANNGVLHIRIQHASAPEFQHLSPLIIERVNGYYGFNAVGRLRLVHGPLPKPSQDRRSRRRPLSDAERQDLDCVLAGTDDPRLRRALARMGESLLGRESAAETESAGREQRNGKSSA